MTTLIEQLLTKLGLKDEPNMLDKTNELVRLLELRSTNVPLQINEYGKIVICADLAASLLGIPFDKEQALKLSGLRKSNYGNNKRMFEKLLDLNKLVGINDICVQLSLNQVNTKAEELLDLYRKVAVSEQSLDVDVSHPQYAAMAIYMACKLCKQKVSKTKLVPFSNLRPAQWQQLEQRWESFLAKHYKSGIDKKSKLQNTENQGVGVPNGTDAKRNNNNMAKGSEIEDYDKWKNRMLTMARSKLDQQSSDKEPITKANDSSELDFTEVIDNMILGH